MDQDLSLTLPFDITSADTDMEARLRLSSLVNFLVQAAIASADSLGFGHGGLKQQHLFWVLNRMSVEMERPLKWYEKITVTTWPKDVHGLLYIRDYLVHDSRQAVVARSTTGWLAIDKQSKRPKNVDAIEADLYVHMRERHAISGLPPKLQALSGGEPREISPAWNDFDLNGHVTSSRYVDWMMDHLDPAFHREHYPKQLDINFLKETLPGERLLVACADSGNDVFHFEGMQAHSGLPAFRGSIAF